MENNYFEQPEPEDFVRCIQCGCRISDTQHDDQGGYCDECASADSYQEHFSRRGKENYL